VEILPMAHSSVGPVGPALQGPQLGVRLMTVKVPAEGISEVTTMFESAAPDTKLAALARARFRL